MVIDFGRIKKFMIDILDAAFDHAFVVSRQDNVMMGMFFPGENPTNVYSHHASAFDDQINAYCMALRNGTDVSPIDLPRTLVSDQDPDGMKIVPVDYTPTAENMAKHMFDLLHQILSSYYRNEQIRLVNVRLYETPNGAVDYPGTGFAGI